MPFPGSWGGVALVEGPSAPAGVTCRAGAGLGCTVGPVAGARLQAGADSSGRESRRRGAERAFAGDPLGLVTHFIPVTTRARLERRPMGRRGGQLLRGTPAFPAPGPRAAVRSPSGGRRPWAGSVSGRGSGARFPGNAPLRASSSGDCAGSRAHGAVPGLPSDDPCLPAPCHRRGLLV